MFFPIGLRLLHWGIALSIFANWLILEEGEDPHNWAGYLAAALVAIRLLWGLLDARPALKLRLLPQRGWAPASVYILIWCHIFGLAQTGWMMGWDQYWGEEWLEDLHENISTSLQVLVFLHLSGILLDAYRFKRKTWMGMITGKK